CLFRCSFESGYRTKIPINCAQISNICAHIDLSHTNSEYLRAGTIIAHKFQIIARRSSYRPQIPNIYAHIDLLQTISEYLRADEFITHKFQIIARIISYRPQIPNICAQIDLPPTDSE